MGSRRLHYIDWLRILAVLLLFPFHTGRVFDTNDPFYVKAPELSKSIGYVLSFIDTWHMPLLFFLAGASTFFALRKRTARQYLSERIQRLLVPLVFGVLVVIPPQTWYGARFHSGYTESYAEYLTSGDFLEMNIREGGDYYGGFGIGHLWFVLFLFVISIVVLPLWRPSEKNRENQERLSRLLSRPMGWLLAGFVIFLAEGLPAIGGKNPFYYLVFFVLGYLSMCSDEFVIAAERRGWLALAAGIVVIVWWTASSRFRDSLADPSAALAAVNVVGMTARWLVIVGLLGLARRYLDRTSPAQSYLAEGSYPVYILHQTAIVVLAFYVIRIGVSWPVQALTLLIGSVALTFLAYEGVRSIPWLRFLFGMRSRRPDGDRISRDTSTSAPATKR